MIVNHGQVWRQRDGKHVLVESITARGDYAKLRPCTPDGRVTANGSEMVCVRQFGPRGPYQFVRKLEAVPA